MATNVNASMAEAALKRAMEEDPVNFPVVMKSLVINAYKRLDKFGEALLMLAKESKEIREVFTKMAGEVAGAAPSAPIEEVAGEVPAPAATASDERVGADGMPLSPDQAEAEALMDAAAGPHPLVAGAAGAAPARRNGNGGKRRAPAGPPPVRMGADGKPLDPEQAALEAQMDAAIEG